MLCNISQRSLIFRSCTIHIYLLFHFYFFFFFFNDTATTEIYTLSLHDALPISTAITCSGGCRPTSPPTTLRSRDRKSTRLNSSHVEISYAVFCLKKKKKKKKNQKKKQNNSYFHINNITQ